MKEEKEIPEAVKKTAYKAGYDAIYFLGTIEDDTEVYSLGVQTEEEFPMPTGLPAAITYKNGNVEYVQDMEVFKLLSRFD